MPNKAKIIAFFLRISDKCRIFASEIRELVEAR